MFNDTTKKYTIGSDDDLSLFKSNFNAGSGIAESSAEAVTQQPIEQKKFTIGDNTSDLEKFKSKLAEPKIKSQYSDAAESQRLKAASSISASKAQPIKTEPVKKQPQIPYTDQRWQNFKVPEVKPVQQPVQQSQVKLPPNLRKVYEDELRQDAGGMAEIADIVAGTRNPMRAQPTTNPRANFRPAVIGGRERKEDISPSVGEVAGKSILTGMNRANMQAINVPRMIHKGISKVWDAITPDFLYRAEDDPLTKVLDKGVEHFEKQADETRQSLGELKGFKKFISNVEHIPSIAMAAVGGMGTSSIPKLAPELARMIPFGLTATGGYAREAENEGASYGQQLSYGVLGGAAEMATEAIPLENALDLMKKFGAGKIAEEGAKTLIGKYGKTALQLIGTKLSEGLQEAIMSPVGNMAKKVTYAPNMKTIGEGGVVDWKDIKDSFYGGMSLAIILGGLGLPATYASHKMATQMIESDKPITPDAIENELKPVLQQEIEKLESTTTQTDVSATENIEKPSEEKTADLNAPTALETNALIPNVADKAKIKPESNIEATEEIEAKQAETELKDDGKSKELTFEEYKALHRPDFVEDEAAWEKKVQAEYNEIVKKDADKQKETEQASKSIAEGKKFYLHEILIENEEVPARKPDESNRSEHPVVAGTSSSNNSISQNDKNINKAKKEEVPTGKHDELNRSGQPVVAGTSSDDSISQNKESIIEQQEHAEQDIKDKLEGYISRIKAEQDTKISPKTYDELKNEIEKQDPHKYKGIISVDWGNSRGQGKRANGMVLGSMADAPKGIKQYDDILQNLDETAENKKMIRRYDKHLQRHYAKARSYGLDHNEAYLYMLSFTDKKDFAVEKINQVLSDFQAAGTIEKEQLKEEPKREPQNNSEQRKEFFSKAESRAVKASAIQSSNDNIVDITDEVSKETSKEKTIELVVRAIQDKNLSENPRSSPSPIDNNNNIADSNKNINYVENIEGKLKAQIESWQNGEMKPSEVFNFGETPEVLTDLGAGKKPLVMTQNVIKKIMSKHEFNTEDIISLPRNIADPIMVFQSRTVPNSFVVLTEIVDNKGRSVIAAIHLDKIENRIEVNRIASAYGRNNEIKFVRDNIEEGNLLYTNSKKSDLWFTSRGLQLPKLVQTYNRSNNSILKNDENINKTKNKVQSSAITEPLTGLNPQLPTSDGSSKLEDTKTVDEIVEIIEKAIGTPIRTGKFRQRAHGIFKTVSEVIRVKVTNDLPTICHEVGHYLDKKFSLDDTQFKNELMALGRPTSRASYSPEAVRAEGVAEFIRLYLTNTREAQNKAPGFLQHFEAKLDKDSLLMLNGIRTDILKVVNLSAGDRILNDMSIGEARKATKQDTSLSSRMQKAYNAWINEYAPFSRAQKRAEESGYQGKNIDIAVQTYRGLEGKVLGNINMAQTDLSGKVIGKPFNEIIKPIKKNEVNDFRKYMVARRAIDYENRAMVMPEPYAVYHDTVISMEQKHSHFEDVFSDLRQWEDNELKLLVDSGVMSQETVDYIKKRNPNHVPLYRIQEAVEAVYGGSGSTLGQTKKVVKRAKGSGKTIIDPLESMIYNAFIIRRAAEANQINSMLADMADNIEGFGDLVEAVPPGLKGFTFNIEEIEKQLKDMWEADTGQELDTTGVDLDKLITLFRANYRERNNEITVYREGKPKLYQVETELYKAIKGLNREASHFIIRWLNVPKRVLQSGAVTTLQFVMRNMARDTSTSLIQSETGINPLDIVKGYISAARGDKWYQQWVQSGGATEYLQVNQRTQVQGILDDVIGYTLIEKLQDAIKKPTKENLTRLLFTPINSIRDTMEWSEAGPRVAEMRKAMEKGYSTDEAAALSRDLSQDFARAGYRGKELNKITAFFNANVQGIEKQMRVFKEHPYRTLFRGLMYVTLPTMLLYFINDDNEKYKQMAAWRKALFYNIPLGNPKTAQHFLSIPKPYGWGFFFGALPETILDGIKNDDPKMWKDIREEFSINFDVPLMPSAFSPLWEIRGNKSWNKTPIESTGDKNKPAYLRYNEKSSMAGKGIANILKDVPGANKLSPKQIDYLVKGYTGSVGDFFWRLPDTIKKGIELPTDYTNYPVVRAFITDTAYSNRSIDDFYTYGEELNMRLAEAKETGTYRAISHLSEDKQKGLVPAIKNATKEYNSVARSFSDGRKAISEIKANKDYSPSEKKLRERQVQLKMIDIADKFNKKYERFKKQNNIK